MPYYKRYLENSEEKLLKIEKECRLLIKDCKMCKYYSPGDVSRCNDGECSMISAIAQAKQFLKIIRG